MAFGIIPGLEIKGASGTEIFGREPKFVNLGTLLAPSGKVSFKPFIYPGTEILDRAPGFLYLGVQLGPNKMLSSSPLILWVYLQGDVFFFFLLWHLTKYYGCIYRAALYFVAFALILWE